MDFIDYYKILEISKTATPKDIKNAYRKQARKYHPDLNPTDKNANSNFQKINEANEVLSDPEKRKKYDAYGKDWQHADKFEEANQYRQQRGNEGGQSFSGSQNDGEFSDFFASMFGGFGGANQGKQTKFRGEDYKTEIHLNLNEAAETHKQTLNVNGKKIRITIPSGIDNGQTIKITGQGGAGVNGGPTGDLYITFLVSNLQNIKRLGNDLFTTIRIDLYTAVLGGEITTDTLSGKVKLMVKPETQNGTRIKLTGKGFPVYKNAGKFGDFVITYEVRVPKNLTEKQKELFTELAKLKQNDQ